MEFPQLPFLVILLSFKNHWKCVDLCWANNGRVVVDSVVWIKRFVEIKGFFKFYWDVMIILLLLQFVSKLNIQIHCHLLSFIVIHFGCDGGQWCFFHFSYELISRISSFFSIFLQIRWIPSIFIMKFRQNPETFVELVKIQMELITTNCIESSPNFLKSSWLQLELLSILLNWLEFSQLPSSTSFFFLAFLISFHISSNIFLRICHEGLESTALHLFKSPSTLWKNFYSILPPILPPN